MKRKWKRNTFWSFSRQQSRYRKCSVFCFDQFSYFDHNLLISDLILVIQVAGIDFKRNHTYRNRHGQIMIISGLKNSVKVGPCASQILVQFLNID